jgi:4,5-DOPA dioxygenase extradiol
MNVIEDNRWSRGFAALRTLVPPPKAILAVSAHWFIDGTYVTAQANPRTIHDFSGFPKPLYEIEYPAPGDYPLATRIRKLIGAEHATLSTDWGLDHGTWSVLRWMFPQADTPVVQLSIDRRLPSRKHFELGRAISELRNEGVLILGSGNVVHNLRDAFQRLRTGQTHTPDWAQRFDAVVAETVTQHDTNRLVGLLTENGDGPTAHPTPDHWLPLLYAVGASDTDDTATFPMDGFDLGSLSMRSIVLTPGV